MPADAKQAITATDTKANADKRGTTPRGYRGFMTIDSQCPRLARLLPMGWIGLGFPFVHS
ncbi:MAG: hypothetical protein IJY31_01285 [Muribaculaceae bacterium]|nr:hypothetical protein [Muribaculaceae bacterium]